MNIRSASFRDLERIERLYREAVEDEERGMQMTPDSPVPQATLLRLWHALTKTLSSLVPITDGGDALLVAEDAMEGVVGFIQAQGTPGRPKSWQILNLCTSSSAYGHFAREQLLAALRNRGLEHGVRRFHVRVPVDHPLLPVFLEHGFTQFATEQILYRDDSPPPVAHAIKSSLLRPARRDDIGSIYLLYLRATPSTVADFEGPSLKTWQAGYADGVMARLGRDDVRHLVAESPGIVAWAAIRPPSATQPATLHLMCEGLDPALREAIIDAVLHELPPGPAACVLRHYDSELIRALQRRGFAVYGTQLLLICELGEKVRIRQPSRRKKPVLVTAGIVQSVPAVPSTSALHAFNNAAPRRERSSPR
jgi:L-amino acid N-acyltransferase YncA